MVFLSQDHLNNFSYRPPAKNVERDFIKKKIRAMQVMRANQLSQNYS